MSELTGVAVESSTGESLGSVVDVVADAAGKPAYVVISTAEKMTAVPYQTAKSMVRNHKIVMDESRLQESPAVAKEQLRARTGGDTWKSEVDQYWSRGPIRSASPEREDPGKRSSEPSQSTSPDDDRG